MLPLLDEVGSVCQVRYISNSIGLAKHLAITRYIFIQIHVHARVILNMFYTSFNTLLYLYQLYAITSFYLHFLFLSTQNWMSNSRSKNT